MLNQLKLLLQSETPLVAMETHDEPRAAELVRRSVQELGRTLYEWSITTGMVRVLPSAGETGVKPGKAQAALDLALQTKSQHEVFLMKDLAPHAKDPYVQRQLRDLYAVRH